MSIPLRNPSDISALVRDQRLHLALTQSEVAARADVSLRWLAGLEAGSPGASIDKVVRTLDALDLALAAITTTSSELTAQRGQAQSSEAQTSAAQTSAAQTNAAASSAAAGRSADDVLDAILGDHTDPS